MRAALVALLALALAPAAAHAAPHLTRIGTFDTPVHVAGPPGDPARVFVVEKPGRVQLLVNGVRAGTFLDIAAAVAATDGEQGLLSIAFAPDYAASGLFYVAYTAADRSLVVAEGRRSAANPDRGAIVRTVFSVPHPLATNHNGGQLAFGPDGLLYIGTGDGGTQGDPEGDAQSTTSLLGKILRLDPRTSSTPTIWALGLRNPWRFSFDRQTGQMVIGDVGWSTNEEIDVAPPAGGNFGWNACEGTTPQACPVPGAIAPVLNLPHAAGYTAVIGGFVVRDPGLPTLVGRYVFGDQSKPTVLSAALGVDTAPRAEPLPVTAATSFGEDACGHVYVAAFDGPVWRIEDGAVSPCPGGSAPPAPGTPVAGARGCGLKVRVPRAQPAGRVKLRLRAARACDVRLRSRGFRARRVALRAGVARVVRITPGRKRLRRLEHATRGDRRTRIRVRIRAAAGAGRTVRVRLR